MASIPMYADVDLRRNQLLSARIENRDTAFPSPLDGMLYFDSQTGARRMRYVVDQTQADEASKYRYVMRSDLSETITGLWTFDRGTSAPFAVVIGSARVDYLDVDLLDGAHADATNAATTVALRDALGRLRVSDPFDDLDAVNYGFLRAFVSGMRDPKDACRVACASRMLGTRTNNTMTSTGLESINAAGVDGVMDLALNDRILARIQDLPADNGIWVIVDLGSPTTPWVLQRAADFDTSSEVTNGAYTVITDGDENMGTQWMLTTPDPIILNTTGLTWIQTGAPTSYLAGKGLVRVGNTLHAIQSTDYTAGGVVWATGVSTLGLAAPNATATRKFLRQVSSGTPTWDTLTEADLYAGINGTTGTLAIFTGANTIGDSTLTKSGVNYFLDGGLHIGATSGNAGDNNLLVAGVVGIGTLSPVATLDVVGVQLRLTHSANAADGLVLRQLAGNTAGSPRVYLLANNELSGNVIYRYAGVGLVFNVAGTPGSSSGTTKMVLYDSGDLGIGTPSPTSRIHGVTTLLAATGNEIAFRLDYTVNKATSGNDTGLLISMTDTTSPGASLLIDAQVGAVSKFSITNTGNLTAVGTLSAAATNFTVDISGNVVVAGPNTITLSALTASRLLMLDANKRIATTTDLPTGTTLGSATITTGTGTSGTLAMFTGSSTIGNSTLTKSGVNYFLDAGLHIGATIGDAGDNNLLVDGTLSAGAANFTVDILGNVVVAGANTITLSALTASRLLMLDANKRIATTTDLPAGTTLGSATIATGTGTSGTLAIFTGTNTIGNSTLTKSGVNYFLDGGLHIGATSGNAGDNNLLVDGVVGIGTLSPVATLDVVGVQLRLTHSANAADGLVLRQLAGTTAGSPRVYLLANNELSGNVIYRYAGVGLVFNVAGTPGSSSGTTKMVLYDSGDLGIGTESPTSRIHGVTTLLAATGNEIAFRLDYTVNKATSGNDTGLLISMTDTVSPGTSLLIDAQVGAVSKFSITAAGNLTAVGTLSAAATNFTVDISGNVVVAGANTITLSALTASRLLMLDANKRIVTTTDLPAGTTLGSATITTGAGTSGTLAMFTGTSTIGNSTLTKSGVNYFLDGGLHIGAISGDAGDNNLLLDGTLSAAATNFTVDISGNVVVAGANTITLSALTASRLLMLDANKRIATTTDLPAGTTLATKTLSRKFVSGAFGDALAVSFVINHALGSQDIVAQVFKYGSPYAAILCDIERTDANNITLRFSQAPATNELMVVVVG